MDSGFVDRPMVAKSATALLLETATNGKAIVIPMLSIGGLRTAILRKRGQNYKMRTTIKGAPEGCVYAWLEVRPMEDKA